MVKGTIIKLNNICFEYETGKPVLNNFCLNLKKNENLALVGPNGSGKSTLLKIIIGLLKPGSGEIIIFDKQCQKENDFCEIRKKVGLLFQNPEDQLFCPTVAEEIGFGPYNLGKSKNEVRLIINEMLDQIGIKHLENCITYKLSDGEKKLVCIASVLAMKPEILLLDEPTTGLDEKFETKLIDILNNLPQTKLIVSHDKEFIKQTTDKTIKMISYTGQKSSGQYLSVSC